jgi:hypothetical protein
VSWGQPGLVSGMISCVTGSLAPEDPRYALIREQAGQIAALTALVGELREQLEAARRAASRNSGNLSMTCRGAGRRPGKSGVPPSGRRRRGIRASSPGRRARRCAGRGRMRSPITSRWATAYAALTWPKSLTWALPGPTSSRMFPSRSRRVCRAENPVQGLNCCFTVGARADPSRLPLHGPGVRLARAPGSQRRRQGRGDLGSAA